MNETIYVFMYTAMYTNRCNKCTHMITYIYEIPTLLREKYLLRKHDSTIPRTNICQSKEVLVLGQIPIGR